MPYGGRSLESLRRIAVQDMDLLAAFGVKAILSACGTISSAADAELAAYPVPAFGVLRAGVAGMTKIPGTGISPIFSESIPDTPSKAMTPWKKPH